MCTMQGMLKPESVSVLARATDPCTVGAIVGAALKYSQCSQQSRSVVLGLASGVSSDGDRLPKICRALDLLASCSHLISHEQMDLVGVSVGTSVGSFVAAMGTAVGAMVYFAAVIASSSS